MKKLMFASAFAAALIAVGDGIESSNIVGYFDQNNVGKQFVCLGPCFTSVGATTFKLGDVVCEGSRSSVDFLQKLDPVTSNVSDKYYYYSVAESLLDGGDGSDAGWYDQSLEVSKDNIEFSAGQAFLANFAGKGVGVTYAGEVPNGSIEQDYIGKQFVIVPNFLPRTITLGEIVCTGTRSSVDFLQKLDPTTSNVSDKYYYYSVAESLADGGDGSDAGWYDQSLEVSKDATEIAPGDALLANFAGKGVKMVFPAAIEEK